MKYHYAYTLRRTELPVFIFHYEFVISGLRSSYPKAHIESYYEDTHGLHLHAYISSNTRIYVNKIHPGKGYNLKFEEVDNVRDWRHYIMKDSNNMTNLINEEYRLEAELYSFLSGHPDPYQKDLAELSEDEALALDHRLPSRYVYPHFDIRKI